MECKKCNSKNLVCGQKLMQGVEVGFIGIPHKKGILRSVEPILVDFCNDCGEINRFYIASTNKKWL